MKASTAVPVVAFACFWAISCSDDDDSVGTGDPQGDAGGNGSVADTGDGTGGDTGTGTDTGTDAGSGPQPDAGSQAPEIPFPCADDFAGVYAAQAAVSDPLGAVVACQVDHQADASGVADRLSEAGVSGVEARAGYRSYRIAYRTHRDPETPGTGTGRLYLPDIPGPRPVVVVAHGSAGLADGCAPSRYAPQASSDILALPWVTSGFVTVLPDYAGLGNAGVQGYGNRQDTTFSAIDAGRLGATIPGTLPRLVIVGHSQGGGVALSTQALARGYGAPDVELAAAISIGGNLDEDRTLLAFRFPNTPIVGGGGVTLAVTMLSLYADWANLVDEAHGGEILHPDIRDHVVASIQSECIFDTVDTVNTATGDYQVPRTVGDVVDPSLREAIVACDRQADCNDDAAAAFVQRRRTNVSPPDPDGAPVLMLSGADDIQSTLSRQACSRDYLQAAGVVTTTCAFTGQDHFTVPEASIQHGLSWVEAILADQSPPACPDPLAYPECPN